MIFCVADKTCAAFDVNAGPGIAGRSPFCPDCVDVASRDIYALVLDYRDLAQQLPAGGSALTGARVTGGDTEARTPLNLAVDELMRMIVWTLTTWEPPVREAARLAPERAANVRPGWAVATAVEVIGPRVEILAALPLTSTYADGVAAGTVERDGVDAVFALVGLHGRARTMLGLTNLVVRLPGECFFCGATALQRESGSDLVRCATCRHGCSEDEYRQYVAMTLIRMPRAGPEIRC